MKYLTSIVALVVVATLIIPSPSLLHANSSHSAYADSVITTIPVGSIIVDSAFDSANGNLYVTNELESTVSVINGATNQVIGTPIPVGDGPQGITFDPVNDNIYVANQRTTTISVINGATNQVIGTPIPVGDGPNTIAFDSANGNLYVTNEGSDTVSVINGATNQVIGTPIPVGSHPRGITFDSANGNLYVVNAYESTVSVINGATNQVIGTPIPVGYLPNNIAFDATNGNLYVTNTGGGTVSVINGATNQVIGSPIQIGLTGAQPFGIIFDSANGNLYVTAFDGNVYVIGTAPLLDATSTIVSPNPSSVIIGNTITFTATVTDTSGSPTNPTGAISFNDGSPSAGGSFGTTSCISAGNNELVCNVTYTPPSTAGTITINAMYPGDSTHSSSSGSSILTVQTASQATTSLTGSISNMGLSPGLTSSLTATLKNINLTSPSACGKLNAFISKVNQDLTNGSLTPTEASQLLSQANSIKTAIGCP